MLRTNTILKNACQKRSHFVRNLNVFERRDNDEVKKTSGFKWFIDEIKYLRGEEVKKLLTVAKNEKVKAENKRKVAVRDYYIIKIGLSTGLRVQEMADLKCKDFHLTNERSYAVVRHGKGGKPRLVWFNGELTHDIVDYLNWKEKIGEDTSPENPFFLSSNTKSHMTTRALQKAFKRTIAKAGIDSRYSIHATRHTYACNLYKASNYNLRLVQKQLGHSSIKTTQVYADVFDEDMEKALERLYC